MRDILRRHVSGEQLTGEDSEFIRALIDLHPTRKYIIDCGISYIWVQEVPDAYHRDRPAKRFVVRRTDSSQRDFSWHHALYPRSAARQLNSILRNLISPQIQTFRDRTFRGTCEACGVPCARESIHVDHQYPWYFETLVAGWLLSLDLTAEDIAIVNRIGYEQNSYLEDAILAEQWKEYHEINARLRCICPRCNLSTLRKAAG